MDKLFLDQTFKLYKSNDVLPELSEQQLDYIANIICKYLFQTLSNDIISDYKSYTSLRPDCKLTNNSKRFNKFIITYVSIRFNGLLPRQTIIFINRLENKDKTEEFSTLVMVKTTNLAVLTLLIQAIENLSTETPIIIKELKLAENSIKLILNNLSKSLLSINNYSEIIGDVELIYQTGHLVSNDSLRNIIINVPEKDIKGLSNSQGLIDNVNEFLKTSSLLNFNNIPLIRFTSRLINLSQEGKLKISSDKLHLVPNDAFLDGNLTSNQLLDTQEQEQESTFIWFLIGSLYNENLTS